MSDWRMFQPYSLDDGLEGLVLLHTYNTMMAFAI